MIDSAKYLEEKESLERAAEKFKEITDQERDLARDSARILCEFSGIEMGEDIVDFLDKKFRENRFTLNQRREFNLFLHDVLDFMGRKTRNSFIHFDEHMSKWMGFFTILFLSEVAVGIYMIIPVFLRYEGMLMPVNLLEYTVAILVIVLGWYGLKRLFHREREED